MPEGHSPEQLARQTIDAPLRAAGWLIQDRTATNLHAGRGGAIREFRLEPGHGIADYLLFVDGNALGALEAKKVGEPLRAHEGQAEDYAAGLPPTEHAPIRPLPFLYLGNGTETLFTNGLDPFPCQGRQHFGFEQLQVTPVPLPPVAEAERIADAAKADLSVADAAIAPSQAAEARVARLRQSILKWAFEGRLTEAEAANLQPYQDVDSA